VKLKELPLHVLVKVGSVFVRLSETYPSLEADKVSDKYFMFFIAKVAIQDLLISRSCYLSHTS
jgi:hypothetical protein